MRGACTQLHDFYNFDIHTGDDACIKWKTMYCTVQKLNPFMHQPLWTLIRVPIYSENYVVLRFNFFFVHSFFEWMRRIKKRFASSLFACAPYTLNTCTRIELKRRRNKPIKTVHFVKINAAFFSVKWSFIDYSLVRARTLTHIICKIHSFRSMMFVERNHIVKTDKCNMPNEEEKNGTFYKKL